MKCLLRLIKVLACLQTSRQKAYLRTNIVNYQILLYHQSAATGIKDMFESNISCLDEESGECSFAALSRLVSHQSQKINFKKLAEKYKLIPIYRQVVSELSLDVTAPLCANNTTHNLTETSAPVKATAAYLNLWIHKARNGQLLSYPMSKQSLASFAKAQKHLFRNRDVTEIYLEDSTDIIKEAIEYCKQSTAGYFLQEFDDIWPECKIRPPPLPPLSDGISSSDNNEDDGSAEYDDDVDELGSQIIDEQIDVNSSVVNSESEDEQKYGSPLLDYEDGDPGFYSEGEHKRDGITVRSERQLQVDQEPDSDELGMISVRSVPSSNVSVKSTLAKRFDMQVSRLRGKRKRKIPDRGAFVA